jgi:hypothetical protein
LRFCFVVLCSSSSYSAASAITTCADGFEVEQREGKQTGWREVESGAPLAGSERWALALFPPKEPCPRHSINSRSSILDLPLIRRKGQGYNSRQDRSGRAVLWCLSCAAAAVARVCAGAAMSWKAKIAGMTGRATMISVIADEVRRAPLPLTHVQNQDTGWPQRTLACFFPSEPRPGLSQRRSPPLPPPCAARKHV